MIIAVCGPISSGKTTLSKNISKLFNFLYVPHRRHELSFLYEFFQDIPKAFFKTQVSFLTSKTLEIGECSKSNNIVIDRSLFEDINIYAQLWMDLYPIDEKEKTLYKSLSAYLCSTISSPSVYIVCKCGWEVLQGRYQKRQRREFEKNYPEGYLEQLFERYQNIEYPTDAYIIEVDTENIDVRLDESTVSIMSYIMNCIEQTDYEQLSLFDIGKEAAAKQDSISEHIRLLHKPSMPLMEQLNFAPVKKQIYLAAPFTEFAIEEPIQKNNHVPLGINSAREYNILPQKYQRLLKRIKGLISCNGEFNVILPHKDENNWGRTYKSSDQLVRAMIENMRNSDLLVAVVSNSIGVHMEMAMMSIQQKPMVLFVIDSLTSGFYADGHKWQENIKVIHVRALKDIIGAIKKYDVLSFIRGELEK